MTKEKILSELNGYAKKDPLSFTRTIIGSEDFDFIANRIYFLSLFLIVSKVDVGTSVVSYQNFYNSHKEKDDITESEFETIRNLKDSDDTFYIKRLNLGICKYK